MIRTLGVARAPRRAPERRWTPLPVLAAATAAMPPPRGPWRSQEQVAPRQPSTTISVGCLGGPPLRVGNFIFAEAVEVTSATWWAAHQNIGCIVQCTSTREVYLLPHNAATSQRFNVDPRSENERQAMLDRCIGQVQKCLEAGLDVLWHCRQSFHRGPVTAAAGYARLTGLSPQAHALITCIEITTMVLGFIVVLVLSVLQYSCQREIACTVDYIFMFVYCNVFVCSIRFH